MKKIAIPTVFVLVYFALFFIVNNRGYRELHRNSLAIQYERIGFPRDCPFIVTHYHDLGEEEIKGLAMIEYKRHARWIYEHNGLWWILGLCVIGLAYSRIQKSKKNVIEQVAASDR